MHNEEHYFKYYHICSCNVQRIFSFLYYFQIRICLPCGNYQQIFLGDQLDILKLPRKQVFHHWKVLWMVIFQCPQKRDQSISLYYRKLPSSKLLQKFVNPNLIRFHQLFESWSFILGAILLRIFFWVHQFFGWKIFRIIRLFFKIFLFRRYLELKACISLFESLLFSATPLNEFHLRCTWLINNRHGKLSNEEEYTQSIYDKNVTLLKEADTNQLCILRT
jgi:hypothetical protein